MLKRFSVIFEEATFLSRKDGGGQRKKGGERERAGNESQFRLIGIDS